MCVPRAGETGIQTSGGDAGLVPTADVIWTLRLIILMILLLLSIFGEMYLHG